MLLEGWVTKEKRPTKLWMPLLGKLGHELNLEFGPSGLARFFDLFVGVHPPLNIARKIGSNIRTEKKYSCMKIEHKHRKDPIEPSREWVPTMTATSTINPISQLSFLNFTFTQSMDQDERYFHAASCKYIPFRCQAAMIPCHVHVADFRGISSYENVLTPAGRSEILLPM